MEDVIYSWSIWKDFTSFLFILNWPKKFVTCRDVAEQRTNSIGQFIIDVIQWSWNMWWITAHYSISWNFILNWIYKTLPYVHANATHSPYNPKNVPVININKQKEEKTQDVLCVVMHGIKRITMESTYLQICIWILVCTISRNLSKALSINCLKFRKWQIK